MFTNKLDFFLLCFMCSQMLPGCLGQTDWTYEDPDSWAKTYPSCGGSRQSPVHIETDKVKSSLAYPMSRTGYDKTPKSMTLANTGHSVTLTADWADDEIPEISGGHQLNAFAFNRIDFHWGSGYLNGSEHTMDDFGRCLEVQFVHYNRDAKSMENSATYKNGRAIVSIFGVKKNDTNHPALNAVGNALSKITEPGSKVQITPFPLNDFEWTFVRGYRTYQGSMTIPPCEEVVMWLLPNVFNYFIGYELFALFQTIKLNGGTDNNIRPTQPLGDRQILDYW